MTISERALGVREMPDTRKRIVSDDDVEMALAWLRDSAQLLGKAAEAAENASNYVKHMESLLFLANEGKNAEERKAKAKCDDRWMKATDDEAKAVGELTRLRALRDAASAVIEAWRSEQANYRAMRL